jgi:hypothetical protein
MVPPLLFLQRSVRRKKEEDMPDVVEAARRHDEAFNAHDVEARMASETTDVESVLPGGITLRGPEQVVGLLQTFWEALPDAKVEAEDQVASG